MLNKKQYVKGFPSINVDNPWEYYNTDDIEDIPKHLRKKAIEIRKWLVKI